MHIHFISCKLFFQQYLVINDNQNVGIIDFYPKIIPLQ